MFVELHLLQNFAPSNLNRDDTGTPKECEFGGYRRARISSQSLKRAIRTVFKNEKLVPESHLASRTKRLVEDVGKRLERAGKPADTASRVVVAALGSQELKVGADGKTEYLLFLGEAEIIALTEACLAHWDDLAAVVSEPAPPAGGTSATGGRSARDAKRAASAAVPAAVRDTVRRALDGGRAVDLALFGRMLADLPDRNVDAAAQVAHAISTNRVNLEFDFYTAVDDLKPDDTAGADMLGTVEFNSACFYRYANVDLEQLKKNLGGDEELARRAIEAFLRASVLAIPTGKQNSMAAQNPPSFLMAVVRESGLWSLANAFVKPIQPDRNDLVAGSILALDRYWGQLVEIYGGTSIAAVSWAALGDERLTALDPYRAPNFAAVVERVGAAIHFGAADGRAA